MQSTNKRTLLKTVCWRVIALIIAGSVLYIATGSVEFTAAVTAVQQALSACFYYIHERVWNRITWGRVKV